MARPEQSCTDLTGGSPVQASIGALGSRLQFREEIPGAERSVESPSCQRGAKKRAATLVNTTASSNYQPKGVERAEPVISWRRQQTVWVSGGWRRPNPCTGSFRGIGVGTIRQGSAEQERSSSAASQAKR